MFDDGFENSSEKESEQVKELIDTLDEKFPEPEKDTIPDSQTTGQELDDTTTLEDEIDFNQVGEYELPSIQLLRDDEDKIVETIQFLPQSLMNIIVDNTGQTMMTSIQMKDNNGQIRYNASSGGSTHHWVTRVQNTRSYGEWQFVIECPMLENQEPITLEIPFYIVEELQPLPRDRIIEEKIVEEPIPAPEEEIVKEVVEEVPEVEPAVVMDLTAISGIGSKRKEDFEAAGFYTVENVAEASLEELQDISGIGPATSRKIKSNAIELLGRDVDLKVVPEPEPAPVDKTDISSISGIGPKTKTAFREAGFKTPEDVARASLEELQKIKGVGPATAKKFKKGAAELLELEVEIPAEPIEVKKIIDPQDLTQIKGIGPKSQLMFENAGYGSIKDVATASVEDLQKLRGFGASTSEKVIAHAREIVKELGL